MLKYVSFFRYTAEAWERMVAKPENRAVAARRLIEEVGGKMESFYWMLGEWDGFVVYEVPSVAVASAFSGRVTSSGLIAGIRTEQLISMDEARTALEMALGLASVYIPPGAQGEWRADYDVLGG